jgi:hypothetical protein
LSVRTGIGVGDDAQRERGRTGIECGARNAEIAQDVAQIVAADFGAGPQAQPAHELVLCPLILEARIVADDLLADSEQLGPLDRPVLDNELAASLRPNNHPVDGGECGKHARYGPRALRYARSSPVTPAKIPMVSFETKSGHRMPITLIPVTNILEGTVGKSKRS